MKIKFLGAARTVTGSNYLVITDEGEQILIDMGMWQGDALLDALNYQPLEIDGSEITGVILTHAHLDHCGRLPLLIKNGFKGNIFMTEPTADLTELSLLDSARISTEDDKQGLYNKEEVLELVKTFKTVKYDQQFNIGKVGICLRDAGHVMGSASVEITVDGKNIVFSGDLGNTPEDLTRPTEYIKTADAVVMESTYGGREHDKTDPKEKIQAEINQVEKDEGTLLIPAFSLERTQELLHIISHLKREGKVAEETKIYLDSPMAEKATDIYEKYRGFMNKEIAKDYLTADPFKFPGLVEVKDRRESEKINNTPGTKVIISGSGMMTGGRIVNHARIFLMIGSTRLLFVGFQAEETLGRRILEGAREVEIDGQKLHINAAISETQALSSHADQPKLINWLKQIKGVQKVFLTHGEIEGQQILAEMIKNELRIAEVGIPEKNEEIEI